MYILLDRSLTFPSVDYISNQIIKAARDWASTDTPIVIDCHHIHYGDFSAAEVSILKFLVILMDGL